MSSEASQAEASGSDLRGGWRRADSPQRRAMHLLAQAAAPERRVMGGALAGLAAAALLEAFGPVLAKLFIDRHLLPRNSELATMVALLVGVLLAGSVASTLRFWQLTRMAGLAMRSVQRLRERVFDHVLALPMAYFDRSITGQLVSRVTNDTEAVKALYVQVLFVMLDSLIVLAGALVAMAWLDWRLMGIVALLVPAVFLIVWIYQRWSAPAVARSRALRSDLNAGLSESIAGMAVLQATNAAGAFRERFGRSNEAYYQARQAELRANAWLLRPALDLINLLLLCVVIWVFGLREFGGGLSAVEVGVLYAFINYLGRVTEPLIQFTMQFSMLQQSVISAARVARLLDEPTTPLPPGAGTIGPGRVALRRLGFAYQPDTPVLHDIDLVIPAGGFYGIVGHTGSGKSTLLALLLRFYPPSTGQILLDDAPLASLDEATLRATVGLVPQEPFLVADTVRENLDMGRGLDEATLQAAARAAHADGFIRQLEDGYETKLGEGGARLSVGQKQLIAIARALAGRPRILLLDEATAHVDSDTEQIVQSALEALRGQVTVIAIAHRLSTIRHADRIVVMNHGRIDEQGTHAELMRIDGGIYRRLYELQQLEGPGGALERRAEKPKASSADPNSN
ncbi:MAG: ATP-binding cassette domain-containing protein [Rhodocyclaceae bacterium]|nr:ATP-binding cassette domain-containing protein [Rhodocyclaceae bacterium]